MLFMEQFSNFEFDILLKNCLVLEGNQIRYLDPK